MAVSPHRAVRKVNVTGREGTLLPRAGTNVVPFAAKPAFHVGAAAQTCPGVGTSVRIRLLRHEACTVVAGTGTWIEASPSWAIAQDSAVTATTAKLERTDWCIGGLGFGPCRKGAWFASVTVGREDFRLECDRGGAT